MKVRHTPQEATHTCAPTCRLPVLVKMSPAPIQTNGDETYLANGNEASNKHAHTNSDPKGEIFQHLPKIQQNVLLLHGPRQKYTLDRNGHIPELRSNREILVQVNAINPPT